MTKERRLAIEMWKDIRNMLSVSDRVTHGDISSYKYMFCKTHKLSWRNHCWFCQYIPRCSKCPLSDCDTYSDYDDVVNDRLSTGVRVAACSAIIRALGGEV